MTVRPMRVCLVASEMLGAHKNGGIGTATTHLALFMASIGHAVTIVYTGANPIDHGNPWVTRCRSAQVEVKRLDTRSAEIYPIWLRESCVIYDYLRSFEYDLILFQDWEGGAFSSVMSKRAGLSFAKTRLVVIAHGPTAWLLDANRSIVPNQQVLAQLYMERTVFEQADEVICPSRHMMDWLMRQGLPLAGRIAAIPLYLWSDQEGDARRRASAPLDRVRTIAYFGRLETRKGVDLFLDAMLDERLASRSFEVVFVGKPASHRPEQILSIVEARRPGLGACISFETDLDSDEAQRFLIEHRCLAVIPSLIDNAPCVVSECLRRNIPFLSTITGGIPELMAEEDVSRVLVPPTPDALAQRIAAVLDRPFAPARAAYTEAVVGRQWTVWLNGLDPAATRHSSRPVRSSSDHAERIAVVVTHYNRPKLLGHMLESLATQTRTDFELLIVDDGSATRDSHEALDAVERRRWPFQLRVLRQPNRYVGAARNVGLRAITAERVIFVDDDNAAFPTLVETLDHAMSSSGADVVTCQMSIFREAQQGPDPAEFDAAERWAFLGDAVELGLSINCFGDTTGIYRRSLFDRIGYYHEWRGVGYEDWHLHARAALAGATIVSLPVPLFWYRRVPSGMLLSSDRFSNYQIIRDVYRDALPPGLQRFVDLSIRNEFVNS